MIAAKDEDISARDERRDDILGGRSEYSNAVGASGSSSSSGMSSRVSVDSGIKTIRGSDSRIVRSSSRSTCVS